MTPSIGCLLKFAPQNHLWVVAKIRLMSVVAVGSAGPRSLVMDLIRELFHAGGVISRRP